jgi:hypothetical protein
MGESRREQGRSLPPGVGARLEALRGLYVAETTAHARQRLDQALRASGEPFAEAVARRLGQLRALSDLTRHLHQRRRSGSPLQHR